MDELFNYELEEAVLACVLINSDTWTEMAVKPSDFYIHKNVMIAKTIEKLDKAGSGIDYNVIGHELKNNGMLNEIGGMAYIDQTYNLSTNSSLQARYYAEQLKSLALRRKVQTRQRRSCNSFTIPKRQTLTITSEARQFLDGALNHSNIGQINGEALKEFDEGIELRKGQDLAF